MAYFDMDKNSLPEQVQENKEKIKDLETNSATITYVDDKDADTLQAAKDYADGKDTTTLQAAKDYADQQKIPKSALHAKGSMIYGSDVYTPANLNIGNTGDVLQVSADGIPEWQAKGIKAANIDSETAANGKILTADGNGNASWQDPSGSGGETLIWSGSVGVTNSIADVTGVSLKNNQKYKLLLTNSSGKGFYFEIKTTQYPLTEITQGYGYYIDGYYLDCAVRLCIVQPASVMRIRYVYGTAASSNTAFTSTIYLKEVYEVQ